jgi:hypothetical protein
VVGARLAPAVTILLDDAERPGEAEVLRRWAAEQQFDSRLVRGPAGRSYAVVQRRDPPTRG